MKVLCISMLFLSAMFGFASVWTSIGTISEHFAATAMILFSLGLMVIPAFII